MWWAAGVMRRQVIQDRWRGRLQNLLLNRRKTANADGGPAADGLKRI
jgi:hypothetical protein